MEVLFFTITDSFILAPYCLQAMCRCCSDIVPFSIFSVELMITLDTLCVSMNSEILVTSGKNRITFLIFAAVFLN